MADRRLRVFYTVARLLSFTRAAEALHMTQPAVTFQIRQLEEHLDARLFDRAHNRVRLTEPGRKVFEYAERIFELYAEMEASLKELTQDVSGVLTLGASGAAAECLLPSMLGDFKRKHPELELRLKVVAADEIVPLVESGPVDVGMVEGLPKAKNLRVEPGPVNEMVAIAQPGHPLTRHDRVTLETLARYPFICRQEGSRSRALIMDYLAANGAGCNGLNPALELGSLEAVKGAVEAGIGVAIVGRSRVARELELGSLACVGLNPPLVRSFFFVRLPRRSRPVSQFVEFARGYRKE